MKKIVIVSIVMATLAAAISVASFNFSNKAIQIAKNQPAQKASVPAPRAVPVAAVDDFEYFKVDPKWQRDFVRDLGYQMGIFSKLNENFKRLNALNKNYGIALYFLDKEISNEEKKRNFEKFCNVAGKKNKGLVIFYLYGKGCETYYGTHGNVDMGEINERIMKSSLISPNNSSVTAIIINAEYELISTLQ